MELILNELSIVSNTDKYKANETLIDFAKTISTAKKNGFKKVRSYFTSDKINLCENYTLDNWLNDKDFIKSKEYKDFLFGIIIVPFIKDEDEQIQEEYVTSKFIYEDSANEITKTECIGLASAYLYESLCISFANSPFWRKLELPIIIEKDNILKREIVYNVFSSPCFENQTILKLIEDFGTINLVETTIKPKDKSRHIAQHHGVKELNELCDRLELNVYVTEMRSTSWGGTKFIRKSNKNGTIEIVLYKTQMKYALLVQTTGRNLRETIAIAEILKDKYS